MSLKNPDSVCNAQTHSVVNLENPFKYTHCFESCAICNVANRYAGKGPPALCHSCEDAVDDLREGPRSRKLTPGE